MKTISDINLDGKRVIIRFDYNVPIKDKIILDDTRIVESLETLNYVLERASKVIIFSHIGRIENNQDKKNNSLEPVCQYLSKLINRKIAFCNYNNEKEIIKENDIIMMENTRFFDLDNKKESNNDDELAKYFSSFGDVFINDAFGACHRSNASNVGITKYLPSCNGFLVEKEIYNLNKLIDNPVPPYYVIMGGKKVSDKLQVIEKLIEKVDKLFIGGAMVFTFLKAKGFNVGKNFIEEDYLKSAKDLLNKYGDKIILANDFFDTNMNNINIENSNDEFIGYDIGKDTIKKFKHELENAKTIFFNGPMGWFENNYDYGTKSLCEYLEKLKSYIVVGGGDTVNAVKKYVPNNNFVISTGGGAALEYLEGKKLPGIIEG